MYNAYHTPYIHPSWKLNFFFGFPAIFSQATKMNDFKLMLKHVQEQHPETSLTDILSFLRKAHHQEETDGSSIYEPSFNFAYDAHIVGTDSSVAADGPNVFLPDADMKLVYHQIVKNQVLRTALTGALGDAVHDAIEDVLDVPQEFRHEQDGLVTLGSHVYGLHTLTAYAHPTKLGDFDEPDTGWIILSAERPLSLEFIESDVLEKNNLYSIVQREPLFIDHLTAIKGQLEKYRLANTPNLTALKNVKPREQWNLHVAHKYVHDKS